MRIWALHRQANADHAAVVAACRAAAEQRLESDQPALARYYPVVRTIEGWHLLQAKRQAEAVKAFEAALDPQRSNDFTIRAADTMARRWLSRLDREKVVAALKKYHTAEVEFPADLTALASLPQEEQPPLRDRLGDAWSYRLTEFRRLKAAKAQRYLLYSISIGRESSALDTAISLPYRNTTVSFTRQNNTEPAIVELRIGEAPATRTALIQMGNRFEELRVITLDSRGRYLLLCDDDFWLTAIPAAGGRR